MNNLFSVFDPQSVFSAPLNWLSATLVALALPPTYWLALSQATNSNLTFMTATHQEIKAIFGKSYMPGSSFLLISLLLFLSLNNFWGLSPYTFTASAHLTFTLAMAAPLWLGHIVYSWLKQPNSMLAHLVPLGTPYLLMPFMVLIELISNSIRPMTLSVRLAANMVAGHLLLTLITSLAPSLNLAILSFLMVAVILLAALESAVAIIQAYVFSILSSLYLSEVSSKALL